MGKEEGGAAKKGGRPEGVEAEVARDVVGGADAAEGDGLERGGEDDDAHEEGRAHLRRAGPRNQRARAAAAGRRPRRRRRKRP